MQNFECHFEASYQKFGPILFHTQPLVYISKLRFNETPEAVIREIKSKIASKKLAIWYVSKQMVSLQLSVIRSNSNKQVEGAYS